MKVIQIKRNADGLDLVLDHGAIRLQVVSERIIHVRFAGKQNTPGKTFSEKPSLAVLPREPVPVDWIWKEEADSFDEDHTIQLATPLLRLIIDKDSGAFIWRDTAGELLVREPAAGGKELGEVTLPGRTAWAARLSLEFSSGEAIYGLGQHEEDIFNYRGHSQYLYQHNYKVAMPVIVSTRGYAIFFDSYSLGSFHDDQEGTYYWSEVEDEMDFYFLYGPEFDQIIQGMRALTGRLPMLPRWAYGYIQSKERYRTQGELLKVASEYRRREIPLDALVLDWQSWPGKLWGQKTFDPLRFPDPTRMMEELHNLHIRLLISVWPKFQNDGPNQVEMREQGFLLKDSVTYDAFNPRARALYWRQACEGLFHHGIDGWWCDCTEPFEPDWHGAMKPEAWQRAANNSAVFKEQLDPEQINAYSLLHSEGMYTGQRAETAEKRVINLTRSSFPGQQRYGTVTWSGDVAACWETLRQQIPAGLNFAVTGSPRWTFDIGGFFVNRREDQWYWKGQYPQGSADLGYRELYVRWFQVGAFLPMFRAHGTDTPREVWWFGEPGQPFYEALVKFIRLRYRLLPYIYSLAGWEAQRGYTMLRSLAFDFRADPLVYDIQNQFMLGPALMVCPVTEPMLYGPDSMPIEGKPQQRNVYLPAGSSWYNFWTGRKYGGAQRIVTSAPLDIVPLFVRAGSILPLGPDIHYSGEKPGAALELRIYPGADGSFDLYEDEGDSYRYEQGEYAWTRLDWHDREQRLEIGPRRGSYRGMPAEQKWKQVVIKES